LEKKNSLFQIKLIITPYAKSQWTLAHHNSRRSEYSKPPKKPKPNENGGRAKRDHPTRLTIRVRNKDTTVDEKSRWALERSASRGKEKRC